MFCRSVKSAVPRPKSRETPPTTRLRCSQAAVEADAHHEVFVLQLGVFQFVGHLPAEILAALRVNPTPLHARCEVIGDDRVEPLVRVVLNNPLLDGEAGVFLLDGLVCVQRFAAVQGPLPVGAFPAGDVRVDGKLRSHGFEPLCSCKPFFSIPFGLVAIDLAVLCRDVAFQH